MVTQSANDLNLTLVVDPDHALSLVRKLHQLLIASQADNWPEFGPSWTELAARIEAVEQPAPWWLDRAGPLRELMAGRDSAYVYDLDTARAAARRLRGLKSVSRLLYALKANDHVELLRTLAAEGMAFECVSLEEVRHVLASVPGARPEEILFTPNFAPRSEYAAALELGVRLTVDNSWVVGQWPGLFAGQDIFLRLDLETGYGHHRKVITSGADSKFGISLGHLQDVRNALDAQNCRVWIVSSRCCRGSPMSGSSTSAAGSVCRNGAASPDSTCSAWTTCWPTPPPSGALKSGWNPDVTWLRNAVCCWPASRNSRPRGSTATSASARA
jgi:diaminopimelate decarboxylase/aspartate kinase